jgi:CHAT domain-containing protein/Tfp pilus assembly protein PilF
MKTNFIICLLAFFVIAGDLFAQSTKQSLQEAENLQNQAGQMHQQGKYQEAALMLERVLAIRENILGDMHIETAIVLNKLGNAYQQLGNYNRALQFFERSLSIRKRILEPQDAKIAIAHNNLAGCYDVAGDLAKASYHFEQAIAINDANLGPENSETALNLNNYASACTRNGQYAKAIPIFERALAIREKLFGADSLLTAQTLNYLADSFIRSENPAKAIPLAERALLIQEKNKGPIDSEVARTLNTLANSYLNTGDTIRALPLYERAITIYQTLGANNEAATLINNLAGVYSKMGDYSKAKALVERSLLIRESTSRSNDPQTARSLSDLGYLYRSLGENDKALPLMEEALAIYENKYGLSNGHVALELVNLACLQYQMENNSAAENYANRLISITQNELPYVLVLDEPARLNWQSRNVVYWPILFLPPDISAQLLLKFKGIVLDSLAEDRSLALEISSSSEGANLLGNIKTLQIKLSKKLLEDDKENEVLKIKEEIGRLQRELHYKYFGRERQRINADITISEILPTLAGGAVLLDFIQTQDYKFDGDERTCYGVVITGQNSKSVFVRIDGGTTINRSINNLRAAINQGNAAEVEAQTKFLSEKLWQPIAAKIPEGAKRLFICPDANLNFLSFAALLESDGRFVAEKYPISYIGSARDLAKKPSERISKSMAIFANPQFDAGGQNSKTTEMVAMRSAEADVFGSIALPPLPGTETEAQSLGSLATESGWNVKSALGKDATETSVRNTKNPGVLHLATHGFYLNSFTPPAPEGSRGMSVVGVQDTTEEKKKNEKGVDPMRASGVALTGAQNTLTSWSRRNAPDPETDGVLTAEEVGALRLDGTWMVVLSACETGVGEARSGEGVFGLRRAFMIAGAENLLMTLWPVADETTAKIMADFYKEAFATGDAAGSLAKVQRDWLVKLRKEQGLLAAVRDAGPFAMVTMTGPRAQREFVERAVEENETKADPPATNANSSTTDTESAESKAELEKAKAERARLQKLLNDSKNLDLL